MGTIMKLKDINKTERYFDLEKRVKELEHIRKTEKLNPLLKGKVKGLNKTATETIMQLHAKQVNPYLLLEKRVGDIEGRLIKIERFIKRFDLENRFIERDI
jgi:hypothetical protein